MSKFTEFHHSRNFLWFYSLFNAGLCTIAFGYFGGTYLFLNVTDLFGGICQSYNWREVEYLCNFLAFYAGLLHGVLPDLWCFFLNFKLESYWTVRMLLVEILLNCYFNRHHVPWGYYIFFFVLVGMTCIQYTEFF